MDLVKIFKRLIVLRVIIVGITFVVAFNVPQDERYYLEAGIVTGAHYWIYCEPTGNGKSNFIISICSTGQNHFYYLSCFVGVISFLISRISYPNGKNI